MFHKSFNGGAFNGIYRKVSHQFCLYILFVIFVVVFVAWRTKSKITHNELHVHNVLCVLFVSRRRRRAIQKLLVCLKEKKKKKKLSQWNCSRKCLFNVRWKKKILTQTLSELHCVRWMSLCVSMRCCCTKWFRVSEGSPTDLFGDWHNTPEYLLPQKQNEAEKDVAQGEETIRYVHTKL